MKKFIKQILIKINLLDICSRIIYQTKKLGLLKGLFYFFKDDIRWLLYDYFFDKKLGIDTFNNIEVKELGIENKEDANRYQPVSIKYLKISCNFLFKNKNNEYDIFLDIGCGKGKPSFYMSNFYPKVKEFIGIDISKKLIDIANLNLAKMKNKNKLNIEDKKIFFLEEDALKYKFENNKKYLIFMFNPFSKNYFEKFFFKNRNLFQTSNFDFIIVNSPCSKISYLDLIYHDEKNAFEIYRCKI